MNSDFAAPLDPPENEVDVLVRRLHETQQRLQELTAGGTDAVIHPEGYSYLLREAQDSLRRSEAKQRELVRVQSAILNALPADVALIDRDGVIVSVNKGWQCFAAEVGLQNATACIGVNYLDICDRAAADDASAREAVTGVRAVLHGEAKEFAMEYPASRDGGPRWLQLMVSPIDGEESAGAVVMHVDVTEHKLAQAEVQRTTDLLQAVTDSTTDNVFVKDSQGRYVLVNDAMARFMDQHVEDMLGRDVSAIVGGEEARRVMEHDRQVIESGLPITAEEDLTVNGVTRTVLATKVPHRDARGKVIGVIGISRDITGRKQAEQRLADQAALIDKARDAILVRDLKDRVTYWNKSAERLFGWTAEEALGRSVRTLLHHESPVFEEAAHAVLIDGEWVGELSVESKEGRKLIVESRWTLVRDEAGQPRSIFVIKTDVTERKRFEQQFLRAQRLESIGTLAGGIAHDLNNALTPIILSIDLLSERFPDPESQKLLGIIGSSAAHGADMVRQVLSFARGVEGRKTEVPVKQLLEDMRKIVEETFPKQLQVRTVQPDELWTVTGDWTQIHQVLLNLCVNARDAMPGGGRLTLSAENVYLDEHYAGLTPDAKAGSYVLFMVEDSGIGMSAETIERIFDPFFTTKEVGKGTGLGLSSSLAIVKSHGGFMQVYSEPGKGTTFKFGLPARNAAMQRSSVNTAPDLPRGNGELILVIDDEASVRQLTQFTLEAYGYRTLLASDGAEGVAVYASRGEDIAVVFTDMMMPEMEGSTAIRILRRMNPAVRIIGASGLAAHRNSVQAEGLQEVHFLEKPYTAEALLAKLTQILAGD